ncbi:MAG: hypothetical protein V4642_06555 [Bacteroidota bacterium]
MLFKTGDRKSALWKIPFKNRMHSSKLLSIFRTFSKKELRRCGEFVQSPYFNKNENVIALFNLIGPYAPEFSDKILLKENVFKKLFPAEDFSEQKVRDVMSALTEVVEEFITVSKVESEPVQQKIELADFYLKSGLEKYAEILTREIDKDLLKESDEDAQFFLKEFRLEELKTELVDSHRSVKNYLPALEALDNYYLLKKLHMSASLLNDTNTFSDGKIEIPLLKELLENIEKNEQNFSATIRAYYHAICVLKDKADNNIFKKHFPLLKEILLKETDEIPDSLETSLFTLAINFCIIQTEKGESAYYKEAFELGRKSIEISTRKDEFTLLPTVYESTAALGILAKEFDWAEDFAEGFKKHVSGEHRENSYHYTMARVKLYRKDFRGVLKHLLNVETDNYDYYLSTRQMLIRAYYELGETESIYFVLEAVKKYLQRKTDIPKAIFDDYRNVFRLMGALTRLHENPEKAKRNIDKLREDIAENSTGGIADWLQEKVNNLR